MIILYLSKLILFALAKKRKSKLIFKWVNNDTCGKRVINA